MVLVIGLCEVGHTLFGLLKENERFAVYGFDSDRESARAERSKVRYFYDFRRGYKYYSVNPAKFLNLLKDLDLELIVGAMLGPSLRFSS